MPLFIELVLCPKPKNLQNEIQGTIKISHLHLKTIHSNVVYELVFYYIPLEDQHSTGH